MMFVSSFCGTEVRLFALSHTGAAASVAFFKINLNVYMVVLILKKCFLIVKINIFCGDLSDISA